MQSLTRFSLAALVLVAAVSLAACSANRAPPRQYRAAAPARPPATANRQPAPAYRQAAPAYAPAAPGRASESLLRLRAGLNVAALSCRGRGMPAVTPAYGRILNRHKTLLASAYRTETQRLGVAGLDRQQTRIYNRFANQRSPADFCHAAAVIANQAGAMSSPNLASASSGMAAQLESRLR